MDYNQQKAFLTHFQRLDAESQARLLAGGEALQKHLDDVYNAQLLQGPSASATASAYVGDSTSIYGPASMTPTPESGLLEIAQQLRSQAESHAGSSAANELTKSDTVPPSADPSISGNPGSSSGSIASQQTISQSSSTTATTTAGSGGSLPSIAALLMNLKSHVRPKATQNETSSSGKLSVSSGPTASAVPSAAPAGRGRSSSTSDHAAAASMYASCKQQMPQQHGPFLSQAPQFAQNPFHRIQRQQQQHQQQQHLQMLYQQALMMHRNAPSSASQSTGHPSIATMSPSASPEAYRAAGGPPIWPSMRGGSAPPLLGMSGSFATLPGHPTSSLPPSSSTAVYPWMRQSMNPTLAGSGWTQLSAMMMPGGAPNPQWAARMAGAGPYYGAVGMPHGNHTSSPLMFQQMAMQQALQSGHGWAGGVPGISSSAAPTTEPHRSPKQKRRRPPHQVPRVCTSCYVAKRKCDFAAITGPIPESAFPCGRCKEKGLDCQLRMLSGDVPLTSGAAAALRARAEGSQSGTAHTDAVGARSESRDK